MRTGVAAGAAALAVPNDDRETTTGERGPRFQKGTPEEHYVESEYTLPAAKGSETGTAR